jgi:hypothetical protein
VCAPSAHRPQREDVILRHHLVQKLLSEAGNYNSHVYVFPLTSSLPAMAGTSVVTSKSTDKTNDNHRFRFSRDEGSGEREVRTGGFGGHKQDLSRKWPDLYVKRLVRKLIANTTGIHS